MDEVLTMFLPGTFLLTIVILSASCALATPFVSGLLMRGAV